MKMTPPHDIESGDQRHFQKREKMKHCGLGRCLCQLLCFIFFILFLSAIAIVVLYFILKPKAPELTLDKIDVSSLSLNSGNVSLTSQGSTLTNLTNPSTLTKLDSANVSLTNQNSTLTNLTNPSTLTNLNFNSNITLYLALKNPNKVDMTFKFINVTAYYLNQSIGNTSIPTFKQNKDSSMNVTTQFNSKNVTMTPSVGLAFLDDFRNDSIPLKLNIIAKANIEIWGIASPNAQVEIECNLNYSPNNSEVTNKKCTVEKVNVG